MSLKYKHVFFDLDRTLWDTEANSRQSLEELYHTYNLKSEGVVDVNHFIVEYNKISNVLWEDYGLGKISKDELRDQRFKRALALYGISNDELNKKMSADFTVITPQKNQLMPYTFEVLEYLRGKYQLHIITNGFEKTQQSKLHHASLTNYFTHLITSDKSGFIKPDIRIFNHAFERSGALPDHSIMIGDSIEIDMLGAKNAGMDQVFYNPDKIDHPHQFTHEIDSLNQLLKLL